MRKDDLKSLVTQMYEELLSDIDSQEEPNKDEVINYLKGAVVSISQIDDGDINSVEHAKLAFTNAYKEIAHNSISSYQETNSKFEHLSKLHQNAVSECKDKEGFIDVKSITSKFDEIQSHMMEEVKRANKVISDLTQQVKELEESSKLDALTKTFNRKALDIYLHDIATKGKLKHELHLLILDIDDFKQINDKYGHVVGDKVLIFLANILRKTLRDGDKVFRYGGEEFVIILNRIDADKCQEIAKRIVKIIGANKLLYKGDTINITVSIGATTYHEGDTPDSLIARADRALYKSKLNGKNQMNVEYINGN
jgi:diguanylate cyclase (GGDEF)-like protein